MVDFPYYGVAESTYVGRGNEGLVLTVEEGLVAKIPWSFLGAPQFETDRTPLEHLCHERDIALDAIIEGCSVPKVKGIFYLDVDITDDMFFKHYEGRKTGRVRIPALIMEHVEGPRVCDLFKDGELPKDVEELYTSSIDYAQKRFGISDVASYNAIFSEDRVVLIDLPFWERLS